MLYSDFVFLSAPLFFWAAYIINYFWMIMLVKFKNNLTTKFMRHTPLRKNPTHSASRMRGILYITWPAGSSSGQQHQQLGEFLLSCLLSLLYSSVIETSFLFPQRLKGLNTLWEKIQCFRRDTTRTLFDSVGSVPFSIQFITQRSAQYS